MRLTIYRGRESRPDGERIPTRSAWVEAVAEYRLDRPAHAGDVLRLLDFAAFMRSEPTELDEVALASYIEGPFDPGSTTITGVWGGSDLRRVGERRDVQVRLDPGTATLVLRYAIDVPHRYWPFGCIRDRCSLSGAIAPLPSVPARGGPWLPPRGRVVQPARWSVQASFASPGDVQPGPSLGGRARPRSRPEEIVIADGEGELAAYPSVFWGPRWNRTVRHHRGVRVEVLHPRARPSGQVPDERLLQLRRDVPGQVEQIASELVELLADSGMELPPGSDLLVVQGPLRSSVAESHPGTVLVSDQAFELLPLPRFVKFHQAAVARALAETLIAQTLVGRATASTLVWLQGSMAFALLDLWREAREHPDEYASDILRNFTFVPAVDRFLYTQQASFSRTYFRGVEDAPPLRNHPLYFSHELPTGRRIHEKLVDTLPPKALGRFYGALFAAPGTDPQAAAERAYGYTLDWFFDQWLGPYPSVDYAIEDVDSHRRGDRWVHRIVVHKHARRPVIEPVQVLVTEKDGDDHYLIWNGDLPGGEGLAGEPLQGTHTFELVTDTKIDEVRLDPRQRLVQEPQPPEENVDPRFNDRSPPALRFLYTGAGLSVAASEFVTAATPMARFNALSFFASFEGSLRRDLKRTGHVLLARDRETYISVGTGANFWFGPKVNPQRLRSRVRLFVTTSWLNDRSLDERGGVRVSERLSLIDDTRRFFWWPDAGRRLQLGVTARQTIRVDDGPDDHRYDLVVDADWVHLWPLAHDHVIATLLGAQMVIPLVGDPEFRSLSRVGGIGGLQGYAADEVFGLGLMTAQAEYRHVYVNDLHGNLAYLAWLRSIGGVLFTGSSTVSSCDGYDGWFGSDSWYGHVGYGLMAYTSILGVTPQLFRVDASVPLVRRRGVVCLDRILPDYLAQRQGIEDPERLLPPFNINVTFNQSF